MATARMPAPISSSPKAATARKGLKLEGKLAGAAIELSEILSIACLAGLCGTVPQLSDLFQARRQSFLQIRFDTGLWLGYFAMQSELRL